jgi:hypothetical protein
VVENLAVDDMIRDDLGAVEDADRVEDSVAIGESLKRKWMTDERGGGKWSQKIPEKQIQFDAQYNLV